jgi:hypothetical protein
VNESTNTTDPVTSRGKRLRFSLLTVLLLTTIVALTLTIGILYREVRVLRKETSQWRSEYGVLTVDDPSKVHAIQIRENKDLSWAWRVFIPAGSKINLDYTMRNIPREGFPESFGGMRSPASGEHVIRFSIRKDPKTEQWKSVIETDSTKMFGIVGEEWFLKSPPWSTLFHGVGSQTKAEGADGILLLHRLRAFPPDAQGGVADPGRDVLCPGFMLWLERE